MLVAWNIYTLWILLLTIIPLEIFPQPLPDSLKFQKVDNFVRSVKYEQNYTKLALDLTTPFPEEIYKVRAIFKWITENIAFDYKLFNKEKEIIKPECEGRFNCIEIIRAWENDHIKKILRSKKALAEDYAKVFQKLCDLSMIQNEVVPGYFKTKPYQIGNKLNVNHTWNAVYIDTTWYFLDLTSASGYCREDEETGKLKKFIKKFNNYYWLNSFPRFARNHYPKNEIWAEGYKLSKDDFFNKPHYYTTEILENISGESPSTGMLICKKGDTIHFAFNYKKAIKYIQINSNIFRNPSLWTTVEVKKKQVIVKDTWAEKKQIYIPFKRAGDKYEFDYFVTDNSLYYMELTFDYKPAIRYKVKVM